MILNENTLRNKIDEYLYFLKVSGYITDINVMNNLRSKLYSLKIERIYNAPGDATVKGATLKICYENIEKNIEKYGLCYLDEVLFHEFSHIINSCHTSIYGTLAEKFIIADYIKSRFDNFTTVELLEQGDELLYNQDPCFGILLLDEFVAQTIAQKLVINKATKLDDCTKKKYIFDKQLYNYQYRTFFTNICKPPLIIETELADYPEFYVLAKQFIKKYGFNIESFIRNAFQPNFVKDFINNIRKEKMSELYKDLCYLGLVYQRVYLINNYITITDKKDPAYDPSKVRNVMLKILNRK